MSLPVQITIRTRLRSQGNGCKQSGRTVEAALAQLPDHVYLNLIFAKVQEKFSGKEEVVVEADEVVSPTLDQARKLSRCNTTAPYAGQLCCNRLSAV